MMLYDDKTEAYFELEYFDKHIDQREREQFIYQINFT